MADYQLIIIGGGLSGIAAGIRAARFGLKTVLFERHNKPGGLNSYYYRQGHLLESGLHAMTNFAEPSNKRTPLNLLFRQLKLSRKKFSTHEQQFSEIRFPDLSLCFSNNPEQLEAEIKANFPASIDRFITLKQQIAAYDPFTPRPWQSTRTFIQKILQNKRLEDMLLLPLMVYGNAEEHDMDLSQFVIMFRSIFEEGFFRPSGTIRDFLDQLTQHYLNYGGEIRYNADVTKICTRGGQVKGVQLVNDDVITADKVISTIGVPATIERSGWEESPQKYAGQMSFMETISLVPQEVFSQLNAQQTILFFNRNTTFSYQQPEDLLDLSWGVICFPDHFKGLEKGEHSQIRITHPANYNRWKSISFSYEETKTQWAEAIVKNAEQLIGNYADAVVFQDSFTPLTIERFSAKAGGAVYGSPVKMKDGRTPWDNFFIAGTDQGYLGIVGSMLGGVDIVNKYILR